MIAPALLTLLALLGAAQLPNRRVGLPWTPPDGNGPRIDSQPGYPVVDHDLPFGERYAVKLVWFNISMQPLKYANAPPLRVACCQSFNAFWTANAALHPRWFDGFGLQRMCRQDVCLSIWLPDCSHDLMFKVTDVCDPRDCPTPLHVKVEPFKGKWLFERSSKGGLPRPGQTAHMYFSKCWADGMPQPDLAHTLPGPPLINSRHWMIKTMREQWRNNQVWNKRHGRHVVPLGDLCRPRRAMNWVPNLGRNTTVRRRACGANR